MAVNDHFWVSETVKTPKLGSSSRDSKHKHVCLLLREGKKLNSKWFICVLLSEYRTGQCMAAGRRAAHLPHVRKDPCRMIYWVTEFKLNSEAFSFFSISATQSLYSWFLKDLSFNNKTHRLSVDEGQTGLPQVCIMQLYQHALLQNTQSSAARLKILKGTVHRKLTVLWSFIHPHVTANTFKSVLF